MSNKNLKEVLAEEILKLISDFENVTGAEIKAIYLKRHEMTLMKDKVKKTAPYRILFEME